MRFTLQFCLSKNTSIINALPGHRICEDLQLRSFACDVRARFVILPYNLIHQPHTCASCSLLSFDVSTVMSYGGNEAHFQMAIFLVLLFFFFLFFPPSSFNLDHLITVTLFSLLHRAIHSSISSSYIHYIHTQITFIHRDQLFKCFIFLGIYGIRFLYVDKSFMKSL